MTERSWWTEARGFRLVLCLVVLVGGWLLVARQGVKTVCTDETTIVGKTKETTTKTTCRPVTLGDPPTMLVLILAAFLLWPDLSEISLGVLVLKRKVEEQRQEQAKNHRETSALIGTISLNLQAIQLQQSQKQNQTQNIFFTPQGTETTAEPARPPRDVADSKIDGVRVLTDAVRRQPAFAACGIVEAQQILSASELRPVKVAIVGAATSLGTTFARIKQTQPAPANDDLRAYGDMTVSLVAMIAPDAEIVVIPVFFESGAADPLALLKAMLEAKELDPDVLLLCVGSGSPPINSENAVLQHAAKGKAVIVAPAGNEGESTVNWPGSAPSVLAAGASTKRRSRAPFSNHGSGVAVYAPGEDVTFIKTDHGVPVISEMSGTAVSAAMVAGAAALLLARTSLSSAAIRPLLARTARSDGDIPILDVEAAARAAIGPLHGQLAAG